jgi:hypothetical protein
MEHITIPVPNLQAQLSRESNRKPNMYPNKTDEKLQAYIVCKTLINDQ